MTEKDKRAIGDCAAHFGDDAYARFDRRFDLFEARVTRMVIGAMIAYTVICSAILVVAFIVFR